MSQPQRQPVSRRQFIATLAATSVAVSAAAEFVQEASAAPSASHANAGPRPTLDQVTPGDAPGAPTVVLVHGAFADSSSWNGVVARLLAHGYSVVGVANPLRSLKIDADYLASVLNGISGPVVLVGHSYGGAVITNAAMGNGNVVALVYVAGFAPDDGESAGDLADRFPGSTLGSALTPPLELPEGGAEVSIQQDKFWAQFAADVSEADAKLMAATQRPVALAALTEPSGEPAWKSVPSRFVYGSLDKNIPAAVQAFMAERAGSQETVEIQGASHVVMISHPDEVAEMIHQSALAHAPSGSEA
jgi:pimeloyl-ACP methyl ester carboxylesterase